MAIEIIEFREHQKNTLQGFLTIRMTNVGREIRDLALHQQNGRRWIQLPSKPYQKPDGTQGWAYILHFYEKPQYESFQKVTLEALDRFQGETRRSGNNGRHNG
jgi:hypothetical protein